VEISSKYDSANESRHLDSARRPATCKPHPPTKPRTIAIKPSPVLTSQQFQALFHSRFQVLFIFPSRYLFTIGLSPVFSFGSRVRPTLRCTPKQRDSGNLCRTGPPLENERGYHPLRRPVPRDLSLEIAVARAMTRGLEATTSCPAWSKNFRLELFPLHSPLLRESLLVSFPPLNNMLKFSGFSRFI